MQQGYNWLPFGTRVLKNIENIIRLNMDASRFIEMLMFLNPKRRFMD